MCGLPVSQWTRKEIHFPHVSLIPWKLMVIMLFSVNKGERMRVYTMASFTCRIEESKEMLQPCTCISVGCFSHLQFKIGDFYSW